MAKYSLNAKTSHTFRPKSVQIFQRSDHLKSQVMSKVVGSIRNSKKVWQKKKKNELAFSKAISTDLTAERVTKKRVFKTAFQVQTAKEKG